jgi:hypothetical protein
VAAAQARQAVARSGSDALDLLDFDGFDWSAWTGGSVEGTPAAPAANRFSLVDDQALAFAPVPVPPVADPVDSVLAWDDGGEADAFVFRAVVGQGLAPPMPAPPAGTAAADAVSDLAAMLAVDAFDWSPWTGAEAFAAPRPDPPAGTLFAVADAETDAIIFVDPGALPAGPVGGLAVLPAPPDERGPGPPDDAVAVALDHVDPAPIMDGPDLVTNPLFEAGPVFARAPPPTAAEAFDAPPVPLADAAWMACLCPI